MSAETEEKSSLGTLVVTRRPEESILIGDDVKVTIGAFKGGQTRVIIEAPRQTRILREELLNRASK